MSGTTNTGTLPHSAPTSILLYNNNSSSSSSEDNDEGDNSNL